VVANELTTAAAEWGMAQFLDSKGAVMGTTSTNAAGLKNSVTQAEDDLVVSYLQSSGTTSNVGIPASFMPSAASCAGGTPPVNCDGLERLDMLANILAACDTSSGPSSSPCSSLFNATGVSNSLTMLAVAHTVVTNPGSSVGAIFGVQPTPSTGAPYQPTLSSAPGDLTLALNFDNTGAPGASFDNPRGIAVDGSGNVFVANNGNLAIDLGSISELTASSGYTSGLNFTPAGAAFSHPVALALDSSGNVFVSNNGSQDSQTGPINPGSVSELTAASDYGSGNNFTSADFNGPGALALDSSGNVFVVPGNSSVSELTAASSYATELNFTPAGASLLDPNAIALDNLGNVYVTNGGTGAVSELLVSSSYGSGKNFDNSTGAAFNGAEGIALDGSGNILVVNNGEANPGPTTTGSVSELTAGSSYGTGLNFTPAGAAFGINPPQAIALDGSGNVFVVAGNSVSELTAGSGYGTGLNFTPAGAAFQAPDGIALDSSGNVFVANLSNSVGELVGLGNPVLTPIQSNLINISACVINNGGCDPLTTCTNVKGGVSCGACPSGYSGTGATGCQDINECDVADGGPGCDRTTTPAVTCINTLGSYTCGACPTGYSASGPRSQYFQGGCTPINECDVANGGVGCDPSGTCTYTGPGTFTCSCPPGSGGTGYLGSPCT
jgi:hypothetical protein